MALKDGDPTPDPRQPLSVGERVALELAALVHEMAEHRGGLIVQERKITGLINVLTRRKGIPFSGEHADQVSDQIKGVGDHEHALGSTMYKRADRIRAAGKRKAG